MQRKKGISKIDIKKFDGIPSLEDLGFETKDHTTFFKGGEREGLKIMQNFCKDRKKVAYFEKPKTCPTAIKPDTTSLSAYLK